jgi:hypothetical protein
VSKLTTSFKQYIAYLFFFADPFLTDPKVDCHVGFGCLVVNIGVLLFAKGIGESIDLVNIFINKLCTKQILLTLII